MGGSDRIRKDPVDAPLRSLVENNEIDSGSPVARKGCLGPFTIFHEGFDPGSELTLAAWLRHASRTAKVARPSKWRKGEYCSGNLPLGRG